MMKQFLQLSIQFALFYGYLALCHNSVRAEESWTKTGELKYPLANVSFNGIWEPSSGLRIKIDSTNSARSVLITLKPKNCRFVPSPSSEFPSYPLEAIQYNPDALPATSLTNALITLKFRPEAWAVYLEDRPVIVAPPPFYPPLLVFQPGDQIPAYSTNFYIRKVEEKIQYENNFFETGNETNLLAGLNIESGTWRLHSVLDTVQLKGETIKSKKSVLQPEFSPNFYSLRGEGTNAIITGGYDFYDMYSFESGVELVPGEMGLVFLFKDQTSYFGYTAKVDEESEEVILSLWKQSGGSAGQRYIYDAVSVPLTMRQWVKLRVKLFLNRVECYLDKTRVIERDLELPPGGKFGLYATSQNGVRFDDLCVKSNHDLELHTLNDIRRYTIVENGNFFPKQSFFKLFSSSTENPVLNVPKTRYPQWLVLGSPLHRERVFSADFAISSDIYSIGLLAGYQDTSKSYLRFLCSHTPTNETFTLEKVTSSNTVEVLENLSIEVSSQTKEPSGNVRLMWDTTNEGEMRMYKNNTLVLIHHPSSDITGAAGLYVGPFTKGTISNLVYQTERTDVYKNKYEKNRRFIEDPYMRHWSSPEGEWLELPNKEIWHKEDVFGRFVLRMPFVPGSEIHAGVEEGKINGPVWLEATRNELIVRTGKDRKQSIVLGRVSTDKLASLPQLTETDPKNIPGYALHYEGYWLWLTSGNQVLFKSRLEKPLTGTRIRIAGFTTDQLKYSWVERYSVKDYLFTECLHEWVINGGIWEVVNRFHCDPKWSNMNGESTNATAALWTKYKFKGDFCVELYAGMRHGWYDRCGDMNITIMNHATSPSLGYTVTCTGWDPDESQLYTRLYRNGCVVAETDKYLAPRRREQNVRRGYEPLIREGRPVHGAWYYIKLRRKSNRLEYYFDNELAFTYDDPEPIKEGGFGLWTFMNSIVVARVRIAAEEIVPFHHTFKPVTLSASDKSTVSSDTLESKSVITKDGNPISLTQTSLWDAGDPISQGRISWHIDKERGPYFVFRNILGSGTMFTSADIPPVQRSQLAGWKFFVKCTPTAQFNFYYSAGKMSKDGKYIPRQKFFHRITGPSLSSPDFKISGETQISPADSTQKNWHVTGKWQPVFVWVPYDLPGFLPNDTNVVFHVEGFGILQPSFELQGLFGNRPGDAYAVCDFQEIRYTPPVFNISTQTTDIYFSVFDSETLKQKFATRNIAELQRYFNEITDSGLHKVLLRIQSRDYTANHELCWIKLPEKPELICALDKGRHAIVVQYPSAYPDFRFVSPAIFAVGSQLPLYYDGFNRYAGLLPRTDTLLSISNLPVRVVMNNKLNYDFALSPAEKDNDSPVLISLTGAVNFFENFEQRSLNNVMNADPLRVFLEHFDPVQGTYLRVRNEGKPQRLRSIFRMRTNIAAYPLLSFRYAGKGMVNISLQLSSSDYIKLSEKLPSASTVRYSTPLKSDGKWHLWTGFASDAFTNPEFKRDMFYVSNMSFGSFDNPDQTGLFSEILLDDLVAGPAVSKKEQLQITPKYFDMDGVKLVRAGVVPVSDNLEPIITGGNSSSVEWQTYSNNCPVTPDVSKLKDGAYYLLLQAEDNAGNMSSISAIPFLVDTRPPEISYAFKPTDHPSANESLLEITAKIHRGAPLDTKQFRMEWNGTNVTVDAFGSSIKHLPETDLLRINWTYLLRDQLNMTQNGETNILTIDGLCDGAGNKAPSLKIPVITEFSRDKTPPTILSLGFPSSILWCSSLETISGRTPSVWKKPGKMRVIFHDTTPFQTSTASTRIEKNLQDGVYLSAIPLEKECELAINFQGGMAPYFAFRIKRPDYSTNDTSRIDIVFVSGDKEISLCLTTNDNKTLSLPEPVEWQSNQWYAVVLNLKELLKDNPPSSVQKLKFKISNNTSKKPVYLQSCYNYSAWSPDDTIEIHAFDASGIEGISWQCGEERGTESSPAIVLSAHLKEKWMSVKVKDRAGNSTFPVWIPPVPNKPFVLQQFDTTTK